MKLGRSCLVALMTSLSCAGRPPSTDTAPVFIPPPASKRIEQPGEMVRLEGGTFEMLRDYSTNTPAHSQTVATFEIGRTEVTTAEYRQCVRAGACTVPVGLQEPNEVLLDYPHCIDQLAAECNFARADRENHPINCITFAQSEQYCRFRNARLPTEIEWEFAAFGTENRKNPWGPEPWDKTRANLCEEACQTFSCVFTRNRGVNDGFAATAPVGSFPNGDTPDGIHDLFGNVWEWSVGPRCPDASEDCEIARHIVRGDGWSSALGPLYKFTTPKQYAGPELGFRCVRSISTR
jgi:formylglycine-generating enzyme required for sulfatase activity